MKKKKHQDMPEGDSVATETVDGAEGTGAATEPPAFEGDGDAFEQLKKEAESYKDMYLRSTADFQNFKRRMEKEKSDLYKFANEKLVADLLPILDNVDRALNHMDSNESTVVDGVRMIRKSLSDLLEKNGVEPIDAVGQPFDPELHNAVQMVAADDVEANHVVTEYQKGYRLNGKVIRHSMVTVSE